MKLPLWALTTSGTLALLASSLDRVVQIAADTKNQLCEWLGGLSQDLGKAPATDYTALVEQVDGKHRFRRDLPFPSCLSVEETRTLAVKGGRLLSQTAGGSDSVRLEGTFETRCRIETANGRLHWRVERSDFQPTMLQAARDSRRDGGQDLVAGLVNPGLDGKTARFSWDGDRWRATKDTVESADFIECAWARDLQKDLPILMSASGVMPRSMWFGDRLMAVGEQVTLKGSQVSILTGHPAEGEACLTLERIENIDSHPCAVFAWTGRFEAKSVPSPDGPRSNIKRTVTNGRVWLSLVHPVLLRSETSGSHEVEVKIGSSTVRWRGTTRETVELRWRATA